MSSSSPGRGPNLSPRRWDEHARADYYVGKQVDQFYLRKRIGQGGTAWVFLAEDVARRCEVAVKILNRLDMGDRFQHEVTLLSTIEHPNLVPVLAAGTTADGDPYLAEPFVAGVDLREVLAHGRLPWRTVLEIGIQIADALHALNLAGIVHRDVKPANIMQVEDGPRPVWVRLIDLSHAKVTERWQPPVLHVVEPPERHKTRTGVVLGSPGYIPPEAAQGIVDARFDVFSLGVTLYQLCTDKLPFAEGFSTPRPLREACPEIPGDLEAVIFKALAPECAERWASAELMRRALEAVRLAHPEERSPDRLFAGSFDLLSVLGTGATATVYRAHHRRLRRPAAVKVLTRGTQADEDDRLRFDREALILGLLDHPCVPRLYEYGVTGGQPYLAMQLCAGEPLTGFCWPEKHLDPAQVVTIGLQLAGALAAVHAAGIVYRDLSTANVLVDFGADGPIAHLLDFNHSLVSDGFYAQLDERYATPPELRRKPGRELRLDTMDYSAPELRAGQPASSASDVFALGVLLYRALTGKRPLAPGGAEPEPASALCPSCPESLEELLARMLRADPRARPTLAQVETYLHDAHEELSGEPKAAAPTGPPGPPAAETGGPPHLAQTAQRPRSVRSIVAILAGLVVAGVCGWMLGRAGSHEESPQPSVQPSADPPPAFGAEVSPNPEPCEQPADVDGPLLCEGTPQPAPASKPSPRPRRASTASGPKSFADHMAAAEPSLARCLENAGTPRRPLNITVAWDADHRRLGEVRVRNEASSSPTSRCATQHLQGLEVPFDPAQPVRQHTFLGK